jgi:hypothetical protein
MTNGRSLADRKRSLAVPHRQAEAIERLPRARELPAGAPSAANDGIAAFWRTMMRAAVM